MVKRHNKRAVESILNNISSFQVIYIFKIISHHVECINLVWYEIGVSLD